MLGGGHEAGDDRTTMPLVQMVAVVLQRVAGGRRGQVPSHQGDLTGASAGVDPV